MKRAVLVGIFCVYMVVGNAQVRSSHDGFYTADSVFYQLKGNGHFKYCVNCYCADSLKAYTGGLWLYSREHAPNTWENSQFSKDPASGDTNYIRPDVVKANTVWVRIYNDTGYTDQHHLIFLGSWRPKTAQVVSLFLDSSDFIGPQGFYGPGVGMPENFKFRWNYLLKMEKTCSYQIYGGRDLQLEAEQTAGIEVSANYSAIWPDKAMQLNANGTTNKDNVLLLGESLTDSLGANIKILRFRVGGPNHRTNVLANEIALDIIRPDLGGEPSAPICIFVNGSFWTYAMAEEGMGPHHISKIEKIGREKLVNVKVPVVVSIPQLQENGIEFNRINESLYTACGFTNACEVFYIYNDTLQFEVDTADAGYNARTIEKLCATVKSGSDAQVASIINPNAFYRYALSIWFFQNPEGWARRLTLAKPGKLPWKVFAEHYDFMPQSSMTNDWDKYFTNFSIESHRPAKRTIPWQAAKRMLAYDRDNFCRVFEDELNTTYQAQRITRIAQKKIATLRPCISECSKAWWPNDWADSAKWETYATDIVRFLWERPTGIANALPKIFLADADTLWTVKDMNNVRVIFDSVQGKNAVVKLNSLELNSDFSGKYYPRPELQIELKYDAAKYQFVKWLEYPTAPALFKLSASQPVTLTPILKMKKVGHAKR